MSKLRILYFIVLLVLFPFIFSLSLAIPYWFLSVPEFLDKGFDGMIIWITGFPLTIIMALFDLSWAFVEIPFRIFRSFGFSVGYQPPAAPWHVYPSPLGWRLVVLFDIFWSFFLLYVLFVIRNIFRRYHLA